MVIFYYILLLVMEFINNLNSINPMVYDNNLVHQLYMYYEMVLEYANDCVDHSFHWVHQLGFEFLLNLTIIIHNLPFHLQIS